MNCAASELKQSRPRRIAQEGLGALQELASAASPNGIVVIQSAGLGDSLHLTIVLHQLRRNHPHRWIGWATNKAYLSLHRRNPHVNKVVGLPKLAVEPGDPMNVEVCSSWVKFIAEQRPDLEVMVPFLVLDLDARSGGRLLLGGNDYASICFKACGVEIDSDIRCPVVNISDALKSWAKRWIQAHGRPIIGLSPFSISQPIKVARDSLLELIRTLNDEGIRVVYFGGPDEPLFEAIDARGLPFDRTAALIHELDAFVGCSSGNLSLALTRPDLPIVAVGTPYKAAPAACDYSNPCIEVATYREATSEVLQLLNHSNLQR
jgi:ADP-heptose:LPS heptosyltransferase